MKLMNTFLVILFLSTFAFAHNDIQDITPEQVNKEIKSRKVHIYDVNPLKIYQKQHLPGAININFNDFEESLPADKKARLIFYCMNEMCSASHQAAEKALKLGYSNVARMPAGITGWLKAGF